MYVGQWMQSRNRKISFYLGCFSFSLSLFAFSFALGEHLKFEIKGEAAILMNAQTGAVLFDHQSDTLQYPASVTKVATALYALKLASQEMGMLITAEQESLGTVTQEAKRKSNYQSPPYWLEPDGMHIGIKKGEVLSLQVLLEGMLIPSGNDAANVIAQALGPTIPVFVEGMNAYLKGLGCKKTVFRNPHGLHDPQHQTTAYDLALIAREALQHPVFCEIVSQSRFLRPKTNKQSAMTLLQTNRLMRPGKFQYAKAIGVKTGWHEKAKKTLIAAARLEGRTLIAVLLGYKNSDAVFEDAIQLFEMAFNQPKVQRLFLKSGPQTFTLDLPKANAALQTYLSEPLSLEYYPAEDPEAKCLLYWQVSSLPIVKDQQVAELHLVSAKGEVLKRAPLLAATKVDLAWPHRWFAHFSFFYWLIGIIAILITVIVLLKQKSVNP